MLQYENHLTCSIRYSQGISVITQVAVESGTHRLASSTSSNELRSTLVAGLLNCAGRSHRSASLCLTVKYRQRAKLLGKQEEIYCRLLADPRPSLACAHKLCDCCQTTPPKTALLRVAFQRPLRWSESGPRPFSLLAVSGPSASFVHLFYFGARNVAKASPKLALTAMSCKNTHHTVLYSDFLLFVLYVFHGWIDARLEAFVLSCARGSRVRRCVRFGMKKRERVSHGFMVQQSSRGKCSGSRWVSSIAIAPDSALNSWAEIRTARPTPPSRKSGAFFWRIRATRSIALPWV